MLSFRNKDNCGSSPYFVDNCNNRPDDETLSTFLVNLYNSTNVSPAQIYVSGFVTGKEIVERAYQGLPVGQSRRNKIEPYCQSSVAIRRLCKGDSIRLRRSALCRIG